MWAVASAIRASPAHVLDDRGRRAAGGARRPGRCASRPGRTPCSSAQRARQPLEPVELRRRRPPRAGVPQASAARVLTSQTTSTSPSRSTRSISPASQRQLRSRTHHALLDEVPGGEPLAVRAEGEPASSAAWVGVVMRLSVRGATVSPDATGARRLWRAGSGLRCGRKIGPDDQFTRSGIFGPDPL